MKTLSLAMCALLFGSTVSAGTPTYHWPPTDPDPYFEKQDAEKESERAK